MLNKIVLDLETQKDFGEVGGRNKHHLLRVSMAVIYSYKDDKFYSFEESEVHKLGELLQVADQIIGFNTKNFDNKVLQPYLGFPLDGIPHLDILEETEKALGHRVRLDSIAQATLGLGKSGSGLRAIQLWRLGKMAELRDYCRRDVEITRKIYEYGLKNEKLLYKDFFDDKEFPVFFSQPARRQNAIQQKSLFF